MTLGIRGLKSRGTSKTLQNRFHVSHIGIWHVNTARLSPLTQAYAKTAGYIIITLALLQWLTGSLP